MSFLKRLLHLSGSSSTSSSTLVEEIGIKKSDLSDHPHRRRVMLVNKICQFGNQYDSNSLELKTALKLLRQDVGMECENSNESGYSFVVDPESVEMITLIANIQPSSDADWRQDLARHCEQLVTHFSPATTKSREILNSRETDHTELLLTNVDLYRHFSSKKDFEKLKNLIDRNPSLKTIDLGYTGLKNEHLVDLLPHLAKLKSLTFLGLRGNRLDDSIIQAMVVYLQEADNFPDLKLVDLKNNEIFTLPQSFLQLLQQRWGTTGIIPTFSDLASVKAMLEEDLEVTDL